jgi:hypothetical protein
MHRTRRIVASTLAIAALGVAGAQSAANAGPITQTCAHNNVANNSGHPLVEYLGHFTNAGGVHWHKYRHWDPNAAVNPHISWKVCPD